MLQPMTKTASQLRERNQVNMNLPKDLKDWLELQATILFGSAPAIAAFIIKVVKESGIPVEKLRDFLPPASVHGAKGTGKRAG